MRTTPSILISACLVATLFLSPRQGDAQEITRPVLMKDPLLAGYLSATIPGLGQAYVGHRSRAALFFLGTVGSFAAAAVSYDPANLALSDYDKVDFGGNGDGLISVDEARHWEDRASEDDAFKQLSTGRKVGVVTGVVTGVGLYIWNIIDARNLARAHNDKVQSRRVDLGMRLDSKTPQLVMQVHF